MLKTDVDVLERPMTVDLDTLEGTVTVDISDWIIVGANGEIYPYYGGLNDYES